MNSVPGKIRLWTGGLLAAAFACACPVLADDGAPRPATFGLQPDTPFLPTPLLRNRTGAGLAFDVGDSDQPKLQLQLAQPLGLQAFSAASGNERRPGLVLAGSSLRWSLGENLSLEATGAAAQSGFTSLGSIHCENGTLDADSYRASNCHFIHGGGTGSELLSLGARYRLGGNTRAGLGLFQEQHDFTNAPYWAAPLAVAPFNDPLQPVAGRPTALPGLGLDTNSLTGIDLEFEVGFSTDVAGDMVLGLQLARVLDADFQNNWAPALGVGNWTIAEPFDTARLSFDWNQGSFSGGIASYYRTPVDFIGGNALDRYATFDVYFSWRAPWNASVSVGASNLMNGGKKEGPAGENQLSDPFEAIYGRIPYVRYKQDL